MAELRDIGLEIFLNLRSEIAEAQATHLIVPLDDRSLILLRCVFSNPAIKLFVRRAGGNEIFELHRVETSERPKIGAQPTRIEVVFTVDA